MSGSVMPKVNGKHFCCPCGCNVFHKVAPYKGLEVFKCNACPREFTSERPDPQPSQGSTEVAK